MSTKKYEFTREELGLSPEANLPVVIAALNNERAGIPTEVDKPYYALANWPTIRHKFDSLVLQSDLTEMPFSGTPEITVDNLKEIQDAVTMYHEDKSPEAQELAISTLREAGLTYEAPVPATEEELQTLVTEETQDDTQETEVTEEETASEQVSVPSENAVVAAKTPVNVLPVAQMNDALNSAKTALGHSKSLQTALQQAQEAAQAQTAALVDATIAIADTILQANSAQAEIPAIEEAEIAVEV